MSDNNQFAAKEINYSGLTILFVGLGPFCFIQLQNLKVSMVISFSVFFFCLLIGIYFQSLRRKETNRLRALEGKKRFRYQVGDEVQYEGRQAFVVLKHGFNHYYLRDLKKDRIILVKRTRLEYNQPDGLQIRARQNISERSF